VKIRLRIFLAILIVAGIGFSLLVRWITEDLKPQLRGATEEPLADMAWVLASIASTQVHDGTIDAALFRRGYENLSRQITPAPIYGFIKNTMDLRVYITDMAGKVLFDSTGRNEGADYSRWNDVVLTLQGKYGTRTSSEIEVKPGLSVMYVAAPIQIGEKIIGVMSVGKPTQNVNTFVEQSRGKIILGGLFTFTAVVIATLVVSVIVVRPIERLIVYVKSVSQGKREALPRLGGGEVGLLGKAFEEMRSALEGKQYVENYVQTLTHEMKSPLAAIQGAVELLREKMPIEQRVRFLINIESEVKRMQHVIERLLLLSSLENRWSLQEVEAVVLHTVVQKAAHDFFSICTAKAIDLRISGDTTARVYGEAFLIELAVSNIFQNALDVPPQGGILSADIRSTENTVQLIVEDQGPGVPDYAFPRIFERFYSLNRPDTGKKSSGLGLSVVQEVMILHGGSVSLENRPCGGAAATLTFPCR
jgi:two-component system, OmpR family, sensor histidine kinase CreC